MADVGGRDTIAAMICDELARIIQAEPARLDPDVPFVDLGLESSGAVLLAETLSERLGRPVPSWMMWEHPSANALADGIRQAPTVGVGKATRAGGGQRDAVAVIGLGCRLPGNIDNPLALWTSLLAGVDAITEVPRDRWDIDEWFAADPQAAGSMSTRWGGFLDDVASFDPTLFRIAPAEAEQMDPQQRISLETAWAALEDAQIPIDALTGSRTGVFLGSMFEEYAAATGAVPEDIVSQSATGRDSSIIPARIAYVLGLRGPVMGVQTACSSSLTAVHLAVRSLQGGESDLALAGGVNLMLDPQTTVAMAKFGGMSPTGRCHSFSSDADGYVRGEGCGVVVLRRLSDALVAGDRIYAVIRGSAVNSDGASNGLTAPSPLAQVALLRDAWRDAGVDPKEVSYVEAHGTGTLLGDPIEAHAVGEVMGAGRNAEAPDVVIGSAKTNFGHLEPASGVVGLIKTVLSLHHDRLAPSLHFTEPNPHIDFARSRLRVPTEAQPWPAAKKRFAGVSSFGFGGSNAHVALEEAPLGAALLDRRLSESSNAAVAAEGPRPRVVFCFGGHGAQWPGMGRELLSIPVFHQTVDEIDRLGGLSLLSDFASGSAWHGTGQVQAALFALQVGLVRVLQEQGLRPDVVLGHSIGEVAAAVCSEVLTLAEGVRVITTCSRLVEDRADGLGSLIVADFAEADATSFVAATGMDISNAGALSPTQTCLSGTTDALRVALARLADSGVRAHEVDIEYPAHSAEMGALARELGQRLGDVRATEGSVPFISTVTGAQTPGTSLDSGYWVRNMTDPMKLDRAIRALGRSDERVLVVEIGPDRTLSGPVGRSLAAAGIDGEVTSACQRGTRSDDQLIEVLLTGARHGVLDMPSVTTSSPHVLAVSGASREAMRHNAGRLADLLAAEPAGPAGPAGLDAMARALATGRAHLQQRGAVVAIDADEAVRGLRSLAEGSPAGGAVEGVSVKAPLAVLFTGQGSQFTGMGRDLYERVPTFRDALDEITAEIDQHLTLPMGEVMFGDGTATDDLIHRTEFTQPGLFALETALYRWWTSTGVRVQALAGHSVGEITAAHVSGMLSLSDAARLVCARGRLMAGCRDDGAMYSLEATEDEVAVVIAGHTEAVSIAGLNSPRQTVIGGDRDTVEQIAEQFRNQGRRVRRLAVSRAFHSPHMDSMLVGFRAEVASCTFSEPQVPIASTVTGGWLTTDNVQEHWVRQVRDPVRFTDAMALLEQRGIGQYLECGPAPVLSAMAGTCLTREPPGGFVPSMRPAEPQHLTLAEGLAMLHVTGQGIDPQALASSGALWWVDLPIYAFQREAFWATGGGLGSRSAKVQHSFWKAVEMEQADDLAAVLDVPQEAQKALETLLPYLSAWRRSQRHPQEKDRSLYEDTWSLGPAVVTGLTGRWLVLTNGFLPAAVSDMASALGERGATAVTHSTLDEAEQTGALTDGRLQGVISLLALEESRLEGRPGRHTGISGTLRLAQLLAAHPTGAPVWVVTRAGVDLEPGNTPLDVDQAMYWGLGQVVAIECGSRWGGLVDVAGHLDIGAARQIASSVAADDEEHVAITPQGRFVRRLRRVTADSSPAFTPSGPVLITGGSGAIARQLAGWLAERGATELILVSRSGEADVRVPGAHVTALACDIGDRAEVVSLLADLDLRGLSPTVIFHAAGVLHDQLLGDVTAAAVARVIHPKVQGARHLDQLTRASGVELFVAVSSIVGLLGNAGQASYAMANAGVDAVVAQRRRAGLPAVSIAWGPWDGRGMAAGEVAESFRRRGLRPIPPALALGALDVAISRGRSVISADVYWPDAARTYGMGSRRGLLRQIAEAHAAQVRREPDSADSFLVGLSGLTPDERRSRIEKLVSEEAAAVLRVADPRTVDADRGFSDLGFDSMMALDLSQRLTRRTGVAVTRTIAFDHPSVRAVAQWLEEISSTTVEPNSVRAGRTTERTEDPIAIVGVGLRMPGGVDDLDGLWDALVSGRDTVRPIPAERFDIERLFDPDRSAPGHSYVRHASLLDDVESFDAGFFGITPREALAMDPQQRLLLESCWNMLESSGIRPHPLRETLTGVFVGCGAGEYARQHSPESPDTYSLTGGLASFAAGRLAYHLGTQGPTLTVDTACSSSLVAMHLAWESLRAGSCDLALAGGVQIIADPGVFVALSSAQALSPDGRSRTFSADANGYGRGEGVGVVAMMRLADAVREDRPILGLVRGSAINHDGASSGITAPNGSAQQRVIRAALDVGGVEPSSVSYVECHGTGTVLGDPIEVNALAAAYRERPDGAMPLRIGTAKSVMGHLEAASGIAGVCKVLAALKHGALPANVNSSPRNPNIDWDDLAVEVVDELTPWPEHPDLPRRAGVSSFGMSGTNVHLVIEQPPCRDLHTPSLPELMR